ncbi:hypothetical protein AB0H73_36925 [Streptomyces olivoreticuli]
MPLKVPDLDILRFQGLVDAAKRALPDLCPTWTDHNVSDPGVTLIEAAAQQVDLLSYRLNRVPEHHLHGILKLLGVVPAPAAPARIRVTISNSGAGASDGSVLEPGTLLASGDPDVFFVVTARTVLPRAGDSPAAVEALIIELVSDRVIGVSEGVPGQRFSLDGDPLSPALWGDSTSARLEICAGGETWGEVLSFARRDERDTCYVWDPVTREVGFGPESELGTGSLARLGAVPPRGAEIKATYWSATDRRPQLLAAQDFCPGYVFGVSGHVFGGSGPESIQDALRRVGLGLMPLQRSVTLQDYASELSRRLPVLARIHVQDHPALPASLHDAAWVDADDPESSPGDQSVLQVRGSWGEGKAAVIRFRNPVYDSAGRSRLVRRAFLTLTPDRRAGHLTLSHSAIGKDEDISSLTWNRLEGLGHECLMTEEPHVDPRLTVSFDVTDHLNAHSNDELASFILTQQEDELPADIRLAVSDADGGLPPALTVAYRAPTTITVYAIPGDLDAEKPARLPEDLKRQIEAEAEGLSLIGAEVAVADPPYRPFRIEITVQLWQGDMQRAETEAAIERALRDYFHPLRGGDTREGWPWGRSINLGDVYRVLDAIPAVYAVIDARFKTVPDGEIPEADLSEIDLRDNELPHLDKVTVITTYSPSILDRSPL